MIMFLHSEKFGRTEKCEICSRAYGNKYVSAHEYILQDSITENFPKSQARCTQVLVTDEFQRK